MHYDLIFFTAVKLTCEFNCKEEKELLYYEKELKGSGENAKYKTNF